MTHTMTPADVARHTRELRDMCRRYRNWSGDRVAAEIGVKRHTLSQYCQAPDTRGSRTIPADRLDMLRAAAAEPFLRYREDDVMALMREDRRKRVWHCVPMDGPDGGEPIAFAGRYAAESWAERHGMTPRPDHPEPDKLLSQDDRRCVEWLGYRHGGSVTRAQACAIAGVDEHSEGLVGYELAKWRIVPTRKMLEAMSAAHYAWVLFGHRHYGASDAAA